MGKNEYNGKVIYMGIDVHKKTYACVSVCEGLVVKKDTLPAKPNLLISYIKNNFPGGEIKTAYEAGFSGFHLHRSLSDAGIENLVVHPGSIEVASRDRVKTDKRDAKKIAHHLSTGRLRGIYIPTLEQEAKRCASRSRDNLVRLRHRTGQKFKALLFTQGLIDSGDDTVLSKKWISKKLKSVQLLNYPHAYCYALKAYADQWLYFTECLSKVNKELLAMQSEEEKRVISIYDSAPGIGDIVSLKLKDELGDMKQFRNEKALFNYLGFTPVEYSSGENVRQGHMSRQGRAVLRFLLVESSWIAIKKDPSLMEIYCRIAKTRGGKRAIVGVARCFASRLRACLKAGVMYKIKPTLNEGAVEEKLSLERDLVAIPVVS